MLKRREEFLRNEIRKVLDIRNRARKHNYREYMRIVNSTDHLLEGHVTELLNLLDRNDAVNLVEAEGK